MLILIPAGGDRHCPETPQTGSSLGEVRVRVRVSVRARVRFRFRIRIMIRVGVMAEIGTVLKHPRQAPPWGSVKDRSGLGLGY
jgi:hypothetical protein